MLRALRRSLSAPIQRWCAAVAVAACALVLVLPAGQWLPAFCGQLSKVPLRDLRVALGPVSPLDLLGAWALMLAVMMPPLFSDPLGQVWFASLTPRRAWAALLCLAGYTVVWIALAPVLIGLSWALGSELPSAGAIAVAIVGALAWSCSPLAQRARNLCHRRWPVGAAGRRADGECLALGFRSGVACSAVCWPWMLVPLLLSGTMHTIAMILIALWLALDRTFPWRTPRWQLPPAIGQVLWDYALRSGAGTSAPRR